MKLDMNSITAAKNNHLLEDQASRRKRKIRTFVFFFILFTIIIGSIISVIIAIKKEAESESISASNPEQTIRAVCDLTPSPALCFNPIRTLQKNVASNITGEIKTTASRIFTLSLRVASNELLELISANQKTISKVKDSRTLTALKGCDVLFRESLRLINPSMAALGVDPDDKIFKDANFVHDTKERISNSAENMDKCLTGLGDDHEELKAKIRDARDSVGNSLVILEKMDTTIGMFNIPIFAGIINFDTLLDGGIGMIFYCLQYLFLIVLVCMVLRL